MKNKENKVRKYVHTARRSTVEPKSGSISLAAGLLHDSRGLRVNYLSRRELAGRVHGLIPGRGACQVGIQT